ncbi:hypothetical protein NIES4101_28920 [Calothrix sp. NIES-4101]|nr:hypothetical protein NIES4101_28920 [Calothrix sp. NIES-4101]
MIFLSPTIASSLTIAIASLSLQPNQINYQSSFQVFFGADSRQSLSNLIIKKSDLLGLTPNVNNTAESLFVAVLVNLIINNTNINNDNIKVSKWRTIINDNTRNNIILIQLFNTITLENNELPENNNVINPMDY